MDKLLTQSCKHVFAGILLVLFAAAPALAQVDFFDYQPIEAKGQIPETVRANARDKYADAVSNLEIARKERKRDRQAKEQFVMNANFAIDDMLTSGRVLFGDTLTRYVNRVADVILKDDPKLRKQLQFYVVKSQYVNAFASDEGYVFVNLGLLAQLENEAQLAFILCHEIAHYVHQHSMDTYLEQLEIERGGEKYRGYNNYDRLLAANHYNREIESEADEKGWDRYIKTPYAVEDIVGVFDVLLYAYLPYDESPFDTTYFDTDHFQLPREYFPEEPNPITAIEDYDDTLSTHPNVRKRREEIMDKIDKLAESKKAGRKEFVVSEEGFDYARKIARYEMSRLYLLSRDYEGAIYNAWLSLVDEGLNLYQEKVILKALYAMAAYANEREFREVHRSPYKTEGEMHTLVHLMHELTRKEQNLLAVVYGEEMRARYDFDPEVNALADSALKMFVYEYVDEEDEFSRKLPGNEEAPAGKKDKKSKKKGDKDEKQIEIGSEEYEKLSKYEKIKLKRKLKGTSEEDDEGDPDNEYRYALAPYFQNEGFAEKFDQYLEEREEFDKYDRMSHSEYKSLRKDRIRNMNKVQRMVYKSESGYFDPNAQVDKLVMLQPDYLKIKVKQDAVRLHVEAELLREDLEEVMTESAGEIGLDMEFISPKRMAPGDVEAFNAYVRANEFFRERLSHDVAGLKPMTAEQAKELREYYDTKYLGFSGVSHFRLPSTFTSDKVRFWFTLYGTIYVLPVSLYFLLKPKHISVYYTAVYDLETGRPAVMLYTPLKRKDQQQLKEGVVYDHLYIVKNINN